jgi:hypothetical protein
VNEFLNSESHLSKVNAVPVPAKYFSCVRVAVLISQPLVVPVRNRDSASTRRLQSSGYSSTSTTASELFTEVKLVILQVLMFWSSIQEKNE